MLLFTKSSGKFTKSSGKSMAAFWAILHPTRTVKTAIRLLRYAKYGADVSPFGWRPEALERHNIGRTKPPILTTPRHCCEQTPLLLRERETPEKLAASRIVFQRAHSLKSYTLLETNNRDIEKNRYRMVVCEACLRESCPTDDHVACPPMGHVWWTSGGRPATDVGVAQSQLIPAARDRPAPAILIGG